MPTYIVKGPQRSLRITRRKNTLPLDVARDVAARFAQFACVTQVLPGLVKNLLALDFQKPGIAITDLINGTRPCSDRIVSGRYKVDFRSRQAYRTNSLG